MTLKRLTQTICFSCGYELAGLAEHSVCPECGQDIAASLELRNFLDLNHKSLSEISAGLAATQIGYGLLSIALLYSVLSFLVTMPAPLSIILFSFTLLGAGAALLSGFAETTTPLLFAEELKPAISHSRMLGYAALGAAVSFVVVLPLMFVVCARSLSAVFNVFLSVSACMVVLGHAQLGTELVTVLHNDTLRKASRISRIVAIANFGLTPFLIGAVWFLHNRWLVLPGIIEQVTTIATMVNVFVYPSLHAAMTFVDHRAIRRMLRHSPSPATPAAL